MSSLSEDLASLLSQVRRPGDFFAAGTAELRTPALEVEGVGSVALPLLPIQAEQLVTVAEAAPYGRGGETLVDPAVRHCWQIRPDRTRLGGKYWAATLEGIVARAAEGLGVDEPVAAEFYKLLIYGPGSFFVDHRDTEKAPGMFATLVVVLPSRHTGGDLVVRHKSREARLSLRSEDPAEVAFAAFYADCVHEVLPVTDGYRLTLVYNLVRHGRGRPPEPPSYERQQERIAALLHDWGEGKRDLDDDSPEKLVYPLEHAYTPAELGFAALKGADAAAAGVLVAAARQADCELHLALLTVEESGAAEYVGHYGRRGRWGKDEEEFEAGEVFDHSVTLSDWRRSDGEAPALGAIPVEEEDELSPPDACEDLTPDEEHFSEATGNEGASFERTYRRAALVLWPADRRNAVLSQAGLPVTLPYLEDLTQRWTEAGEDQASPLWRDAHDLTGHMIAQWSRQGWRSQREQSNAARMLALLTRLDDMSAIETFLADVTATGCYETGDNGAVLGALGRLPPDRRAWLIERVVAGTAETLFSACADLLARAASAWQDLPPAGLATTAAQLVAAIPGDPARAEPRPSWQRGPEADAAFVVDLITGLCAIDDALAGRAAAYLLVWPETYDLDTVLVPATIVLLGTLASTCAGAIEPLRDACLAHLRARVAEPLAPPVDWRRASALPHRCAHCAELSRFLDDPDRKTWAFKAVEADRGHLEGVIKQAGSDVDTATDRRGRPYTLIITKNQASYERRARQREQDLQSLTLLQTELRTGWGGGTAITAVADDPGCVLGRDGP